MSAVPRTLRRWDGKAVVGLVLLAALTVLAVFVPAVTPDPNAPEYAAELAAPSLAHPLGTDHAGRDLLARLAAGARTSLGAAAVVWLVAVTVGLVAGALCALGGKVVSAVVARAVDLALALPQTLVALALVGALGPGLVNLVLAMSATAWAGPARLAHAYVRGARDRPDVVAAAMAGVGPVRVVLAHVLPGAGVRVVVVATLGLGNVVISLAGLSFLGLGVQPPTAEWGGMLAEGRSALLAAPWLVLAPSVALFVTVTCVSLLADALRARVDDGGGP